MDYLTLKVMFEDAKGMIRCTVKLEDFGRLKDGNFLRDPEDKYSKYPPNVCRLSKTFGYHEQGEMKQWIDQIVNQTWKDYIKYVKSIDCLPKSYKVQIHPCEKVEPSVVRCV